MSKYSKLWEYIKNQDSDFLKLTYDEIEQIAGVPIDHSFLTYKKMCKAAGGRCSIANR